MMTAVLSVAEDLQGGDLIVKLAVRGQGIPGLVRKTATATLDKKAAEALISAARSRRRAASSTACRIAEDRELPSWVSTSRACSVSSSVRMVIVSAIPAIVRQIVLQ